MDSGTDPGELDGTGTSGKEVATVMLLETTTATDPDVVGLPSAEVGGGVVTDGTGTVAFDSVLAPSSETVTLVMVKGGAAVVICAELVELVAAAAAIAISEELPAEVGATRVELLGNGVETSASELGSGTTGSVVVTTTVGPVPDRVTTLLLKVASETVSV